MFIINMKNGLLKRLGLASALTLALTMPSKALDVKCTGDFSWDFLNSGSACLSESARTVPIHPADTYANPKNNGPIKNILNSVEIQNLQLRFGLELQYKQFLADFGVGAGVCMVNYGKEDFGFAERNYTNAPGTDERGYGAALTYYDLNEDNSIGSVISPFIRLAYKIKSESKGYTDMNIFAEYSPQLIDFDTKLETGYDRWNRFQSLGEKNLKTSLTNHLIKLGVSFSPQSSDDYPLGLTPEIYLGMGFPKFTGEEEPGIKFSNTYCFGCTLRIDMSKLAGNTPSKK
jgi:hypothetical protein